MHQRAARRLTRRGRRRLVRRVQPLERSRAIVLAFGAWCAVSASLAVACGGDGDLVLQSPSASTSASGAPVPSGAPAPDGDTPADDGGAVVPAAPAALGCLAAHYVGEPAGDGSAAQPWSLRLPGGALLPWDDGKTKTFEEALGAPDLEDTLAMPYVVGPLVPVTKVNDDPGRIRSDVLFKATFGATKAEVEAKLVDVDFLGQTLRFHERGASALGRVATKLSALVAAQASLGAYVKGDLGGTFVWRPIANTNRLSAHSYGIAIDIVVSRSNYWEWEKSASGGFTYKNQIPEAIVSAFESEGFAWGGRWYHYDTMHFELRPELFDPSCKP